MNPTIDRAVRSLPLYGLFLCAASAALATPPVFVGTATATIDQSSGNVKACFKESGLPAKLTMYAAKSIVTAAYACRHRTGDCPPARDKTIRQTVAVPAIYSPDRHGSVSACIVLKVPRAGSTPCPDDMTLVLKSVSWTGVSASDVSNMIGPMHADPARIKISYGSCTGA
jgi:hypothetical protein